MQECNISKMNVISRNMYYFKSKYQRKVRNHNDKFSQNGSSLSRQPPNLVRPGGCLDYRKRTSNLKNDLQAVSYIGDQSK